MAYPPSSYGDRPPLQGYRRSFTLPSRSLSLHEKAGLETADADADVLFSHHSARIILFSPPTESISTKSKETLPDADYPVDAVETLPWRSRTETLAATGAMVIEKVRGSTWFLKSADQKVIHTIMRNSQCWCVDGESKFVLRIGKFRYYRIELPSESEEDKKKVEDLKQALPKILRFERTPCPFKRAFHVDLPEDAITPRRKGAWKRKQPPQPATPNTDPLPLRRSKTTRAWSLQGDASAAPLQRYGRRGSDYGFDTSRGSSPRPPFIGEGYRSGTPSSLASSDDARDTRHEETSSEDGLHHDETQSQQADEEGSTNLLGPQQAPISSEDWAHVRRSLRPEPEDASVLESVSDFDGHSVDKPALPKDISVSAQRPLTPVEPDTSQARISKQPVQEDVSQSTKDDIETETTQAEDAPVSINETVSTHEEELEAPGEESRDEPMEVQQTPISLISADSTSPLPELVIPEDNSTNENHSADSDRDRDEAQPALATPEELEQGIAESLDEDEAEDGDKDARSSIQEDDVLSTVSSIDSFHTTNSLTEESLAEHVDAFDFQKTPHAEKFDPFSMRSRLHKRELSEMTVTASTVDSYLDPPADLRPSTSDSVENPATPALARSSMSDSSWPEVQTPSSPAKDNGLRRRLKTERSFSPLPPSTTLFSPSSPTQGNHFTAEILQKACNVALVKPIEAVVLLVHILARIAGGATVSDLINGNLFRRPEQHRRRSSFPDQMSSPRDDTSDEDDFGVPIRGRTRSAGSKSNVERDTDTDSMFDLD